MNNKRWWPWVRHGLTAGILAALAAFVTCEQGRQVVEAACITSAASAFVSYALGLMQQSPMRKEP